jgi:cytoskeletal protein CcmA (bactofilin family)
MDTQTERNRGIGRDRAIRVSGITSFDEVDAERFDVSGVATVEGDVRADDASLSGSTHVGGDFRCDSAEVSGATNVDGDVRADSIVISGSMNVGGTTVSDAFECSGSASLEAVEADRFEASGAVELATLDAGTVRVRGAIDAEVVEADDLGFDLVSDSVVFRLVADSVVVTRHRPDGFLRAERVEGDIVALDHVAVGTVVGDRVRLGPDARVETVRARELDAADGATVGSVERIE